MADSNNSLGSNPSHVEDIVNITDKENQSLTEEICKSQNFTIQSTETRQQALTRDRVDEILNSSNHHEIFNSEEFMNQIEELINEELSAFDFTKEALLYQPISMTEHIDSLTEQYKTVFDKSLTENSQENHIVTSVSLDSSNIGYNAQNIDQISPTRSDSISSISMASPHESTHIKTSSNILSKDSDDTSSPSSNISANNPFNQTVNIIERESSDDASVASSNFEKKLKVMKTFHVDFTYQGIEALRRLPQNISSCVNSGDLVQLNKLLETYFDENCTFTSRVVPEELVGRQFVLLLYEALLQAIPDYIFVTKKTKFVKNQIINQVYFTGTRAFYAKNQYLFQRMNCSMVDVIAENRPLKPNDKYEMKLKEQQLKAQKKKISIWGGGRMVMTFDLQTLKVIKFQSDWGLKAFKEHME